MHPSVIEYRCLTCGNVLEGREDYCEVCGEIPVVEEAIRFELSV